MDKIIQGSLADLLINLSAGWFIAGFGVPFLVNLSLLAKLAILIINGGLGIVALLLAIWLRKGVKK